jgi:hypothetical protein
MRFVTTYVTTDRHAAIAHRPKSAKLLSSLLLEL